MIWYHKARFILALTILVAVALCVSYSPAYASSYTAGATSMPLYSTSQWALKDATLKKISGDSVSISGSTIKAVKSGSSVIAVLDSNKKELKRFTVKVYVLSGTYVLESAMGGSLVADVEGASMSNEANIRLWSSNGTKAQMFKFSASNGSYVITNVNSNKALDVKNGSKMASANIQQYMINGTAAQKWTLEVDSKNYVIFKNVKSGMAMDVASAKPQEGRNIQQYSSNKTVAQKWKIISSDNYKAAKAKIRGHWTYKTVYYDSLPTDPGEAIALAAVLCSGGFGQYKTPAKYHTPQNKHKGQKLRPSGDNYKIFCELVDAMKPLWTTNPHRKNYYAECSALVTRAVRWSGYDDNYSTGTVSSERDYMDRSSKWRCLGTWTSMSQLKPGDILVKTGGGNHIMIYAGPDATRKRFGTEKPWYIVESGEGWLWPSNTDRFLKSDKHFKVYRATGTTIDPNSKYANMLVQYKKQYTWKQEKSERVKDQFVYDNYKITYRGLPSNMKVTSPTTFKYDTPTFSITAPSGSKTGCTFIGWYTKAQGGTKITKIQKGTAQDYVLYAHFKKNATQTSSKKASSTSNTSNKSSSSTTSSPVLIEYGWIALDSKKNPILAGSQYTLSGQVKPVAYITNGHITKAVNAKSVVYLNNNKKGTAQALIIGDNIVGCKDAFITTFTIV